MADENDKSRIGFVDSVRGAADAHGMPSNVTRGFGSGQIWMLKWFSWYKFALFPVRKLFSHNPGSTTDSGGTGKMREFLQKLRRTRPKQPNELPPQKLKRK